MAGHLFGRVAKRLVNRLWPNEVGVSLASFQVMSKTLLISFHHFSMSFGGFRGVLELFFGEAMLKDLRCPVLLIHGRNDTMIPAEGKPAPEVAPWTQTERNSTLRRSRPGALLRSPVDQSRASHTGNTRDLKQPSELKSS